MKAVKTIAAIATVMALLAQCAPKKRYTVICVDDTVMKRVVVARCEEDGSRFRWFWIPDEEHSVPAVGKDVDRSHGSFDRPWDARDIKTGKD